MATPEYSSYKLRKWSRLVRIRDGGECQLCTDKPGIFKLHAHHIYPKEFEYYAKIAYEIDNGIALCPKCHWRVVHGSGSNWKRFTCMFRRYTKRSKK